MKIRKIWLIMLFLCVIFSSCDAVVQQATSINKFQYTISTTFTSQTDKDIFEQRLAICGLDVVECTAKNEEISYVLYSPNRWDEDCLKLLGQNFEASIVDEAGTLLVTEADILRIQYNQTTLKLYTSENLNKLLHEEYDIRTLCLIVDGSLSTAMAYFDNNETLSFMIELDESSVDLCKAMIAFGNILLTTEIEINVLSLGI